MSDSKSKISSFLALFTSTGTLLCCALPAALAALAGGAAVSSFISVFPWVTPLSRYKIWLFIFAAVMITVNALLTLRPRGSFACAITGGEGCEISGRFQKTMLWLSLGIWLVGFLFAYALVPILRLFEKT